MSTETAAAKPMTPVSKVIPTESKPGQATASAASHADPQADPKVGEQIAAVLTAANPKAEGLPSLLQDLASPDSARRAAAAGALGKTKDAAAVPALITALGDADADVAREAATSLGFLGNPAAVEPLIAILNNHDGYFHSVVRVAATHSLGQLRDPRAVVSLLNAVHDPIAEASTEAIRALAVLPDPRGLPALLEVVRNEHNFFLATTRRAAILGLAKIGGEQAACELRFVAANQWEDAGVRAAAIEASREGSTTKAAV
jgi:HEAT repeat protein